MTEPLSAEGRAEMLSRPEGLDMEVTGHTGVPLRWAVCDLVPLMSQPFGLPVMHTATGKCGHSSAE